MTAKEVPEGRRPTVPVARRRFRSGDRIVQAQARLELGDPVVAEHPSEFRCELEDRHAGRGSLFGGPALLDKILGRG